MYEARLNGQPVGELAINAAMAGTYGVPVAMVSGDQALAVEARALLGDVGRDGDRQACRWTVRRAERLANRVVPPNPGGAAAALSRPHEPLVLPPPIRLEVDFQLTQMADMAELVPGSKRIGGRTLEYVHDDYREVFRAWRALYNLASVA